MTNDLDTRARAGARALHEAVRGVPVPATAPTRSPHRGRVLVLAAAAVVVVAVATALVTRGEDEQRLSTDPSGGAPRLVLDPPPPGLEATGAADLAGGADAGVRSTFWVYGDAGAADPFGEGDLGLVHLSSESLHLDREGAAGVEVDGHPAWVANEPDAATGLRSVVVELDGSSLGLLSATLGDDELLAAAGDLDLDAVALDPPDRLAGLEQVGVARGELSPGIAPLPLPIGAGHLAGYADDASEATRTVVVASAQGDDGTLAVARWALGGTARTVEVRGVDGWSGTYLGAESPMLVWQEAPGVVVTMAGYGVDEATLLAAAESIRTATEAEWTDLAERSSTATVPDDARVGIASEETTGAAYAVYRSADDYLCVTYDESDGVQSEACEGADGSSSLLVSAQRLDSGEIVLYGYTTLGTDGELQLEGTGGSLTDLSEAYDEEGTLFAGRFSDDSLPAEILVRGADGTELARAVVGAPDEGSGSSRSFSGQGTPITSG